MRWLILQALITWNWVTDLYGWILRISKRSIKAVTDAQKEDVYVFFDGGLPLVTRESAPNSICVYTPSTKTFMFGTDLTAKRHHFNLLSARLMKENVVTEDLTGFFAEASWRGSDVGPTLSQAVIAAMLDREVPLTASTLGAYHLDIEDELAELHTLTDFSQTVPG